MDRANIQQMRHKGLHVLRICRKQNLYGAAAITNGGHVRCANTAHTGFELLGAPCTIWETHLLAAREILFSRTLNTAAPNATITSMRTWTIWRCPKAITRIGWSQWPCGWSWKMVCRTVRHHGTYGGTIECLCPGLQSKTGSKQRGKKAEAAIKTEYIDEALFDFSGYIAGDELYDGPFCVLFIVDNHKFKRLCYDVLDHNPTNEDITRFFRRFKQMLDARGLMLKGITTDGSPLYSGPIANVFGQVKHQSCRFHIISEITKDILKAVTKVRRQLKPRGTLKKLCSPNLEKALTFLDDSLLPATSNAVERANRRHRKMQKSIYRVRTRDHISQRIAVDMQSDAYSIGLKKTISTLHWSRNGEKRKTG